MSYFKYLSKPSAFIIMFSCCIPLQQSAYATSSSCNNDIDRLLDKCDPVCDTHAPGKAASSVARACRTQCGELHTWMENHLCKE